MNFDPNMMDPKMMRGFIDSLSGMSDDQVSMMMKSMGINIDPKIIRQFADQMKNADDKDFENLKKQYEEGNINMNSFKNASPELNKISEIEKNLAKLIHEANYTQCIESCLEIQKLMESLPESDLESNKVFISAVAENVRDKLVFSKFKLEDYDSAIEEGLKAAEIKGTYSIHSSLGICYFKKGRYYKAREHFNTAKSLDEKKEDKIVENYLKQTLEMIADIEN